DDTPDGLRCWFVAARCAPAAAPRVAPLPLAAPVDANPSAWAAARHARARADADVLGLYRVALAFARDPAVADRHALDLVAASIDDAAAHAALGALFDALGDPARARTHWHAAVDASAEPAFVRGLAEATARAGDGAAALVFATT